MTNRIHAHNPSIGTASLEHTANASHAAPTTNASGTHPVHRSSSRGPDVISDGGSSNAQTRLRSMQQRASVSVSATAGGSQQANGFEAMVRDYRTQMLAGRTPAAPSAPPLPHMSGRQIIGMVGVDHPDFGRALREAEHAAHANAPLDPVHWVFERLTEGAAHRMGWNHEVTAALTELGGHALIEVAETLAEATGFEGAAHLTGIAAQVALGVAVADAEFVLAQEIINAGTGQAPPSRAVLESMAREIPGRAAAWLRDQTVRAETSYNAGVRRAAQGLAPETSRLNDAAYMLGANLGRTYRQNHGDAYSRVIQHNRAMEQARRDIAAMPHGAAASPAAVTSTTTSTVPAEANATVRSVWAPETYGVGEFHVDG